MTDAAAVEASGGANPLIDEVTAQRPASPTYREGASMWVWDDRGRFAFPRIGVEAVGATWETSFTSALCMAFPGGRLLLVNDDYPPHPAADDVGRPRIFGAGPLLFECVEPFAQWRLRFAGNAKSTDVSRFLDGGKHRLGPGDAVEVPLAVELTARSVAPPWFQNTYEPLGHHVAGEQRFEQLCAVTGTVTFEGGTTEFTGGALRIHRKGGNRNGYGEFHGHLWASTSFPSGRAFGLIHYRPGPDGAVKYHEAWVRDGGELLPARIVDTPWLAGTVPAGEDVSFTLRTRRGDIRITARTFVSSFRPPRPIGDGTTFPLLQSAIASFRWGDEEAYGMIERSARL
ncbi:hypothetical protein [Pseudofrankia inefficax]|uniref:Hydroxyneurosporene synthase n=1 Tax=Pseudofrankia inefficax (strain DSM 45817 / CECT 9037 / DDB 130130 / EuI1c) TaxID=298654 RepID=E3J6L8_PSEI1|nr:hypothetical protein [Pseudofrankia inefficax]ADP80794.1 hypothetical protein FraEuI1c_2767 [Pseudofrankia inefficax]